MWDRTIDISSVREIRTKTTAYLGVGAIAKIADIAAELRKRGIDRVLVMCGRGSYRSTGAWDHVERAFAASRITFALYDKVTPNPTVDSVDEAVALGRSFGAQAVVAIGGGSPIDAGKSAAILLEYTDKNARDLYELKFAPERAVPIVAVNLTHGTGTEVDRFAVVSIPEKEFKPAIAYDCIYPLYAIDDPALKLSPGTTVFYDAGYTDAFPDLPFQVAAVLWTRVISRPGPDRMTVDLGSKACAADPPAGRRLVFPELPEAEQVLQNEEHLILKTPRAMQFQPGDELLAIPRHICPTTALHKQVYVVSGGRLVGRWDVAARDRCLTI